MATYFFGKTNQNPGNCSVYIHVEIDWPIKIWTNKNVTPQHTFQNKNQRRTLYFIFEMTDPLLSWGYVVLPMKGPFCPNKSVNEFHQTMNDFPEFRGMGRNEPRVLNAWSGLANPASFHNPYVRRVRAQVYVTVRDSLRQVALQRYPSRKFLEMVPDSMIFCPAHDSQDKSRKEQWHKDAFPQHQHQSLNQSWSDNDNGEDNDNADDNYDLMLEDQDQKGQPLGLCPSCDIVYNVRVNLGQQPQHIFCIPGSHVSNPCSSMTKVSFNKSDKKCITIPPGHLLLYNATLLYKLNHYQSLQHNQYGLLLTFRLKVHRTVNPYILHTLRTQSVPHLPSGQPVPMYASEDWLNCRQELIKFSDKVVVVMKEKRTLLLACTKADEPDKGRSFHVVKQIMPSLQAAQLPMYAPYSPTEIELLKPQPLF